MLRPIRINRALIAAACSVSLLCCGCGVLRWRHAAVVPAEATGPRPACETGSPTAPEQQRGSECATCGLPARNSTGEHTAASATSSASVGGEPSGSLARRWPWARGVCGTCGRRLGAGEVMAGGQRAAPAGGYGGQPMPPDGQFAGTETVQTYYNHPRFHPVPSRPAFLPREYPQLGVVDRVYSEGPRGAMTRGGSPGQASPSPNDIEGEVIPAPPPIRQNRELRGNEKTNGTRTAQSWIFSPSISSAGQTDGNAGSQTSWRATPDSGTVTR